MIYVINNKYYILVGGYYKEVDIRVNDNELDVIPTGRKIEVSGIDDVISFNTLTQKDALIKSLKTSRSENNRQNKREYTRD